MRRTNRFHHSRSCGGEPSSPVHLLLRRQGALASEVRRRRRLSDGAPGCCRLADILDFTASGGRRSQGGRKVRVLGFVRGQTGGDGGGQTRWRRLDLRPARAWTHMPCELCGYPRRGLVPGAARRQSGSSSRRHCRMRCFAPRFPRRGGSTVQRVAGVRAAAPTHPGDDPHRASVSKVGMAIVPRVLVKPQRRA